MFNKKFNEWISKNFKGLSAATLVQLLQNDFNMGLDYENMVYCDLYNVFCNNCTELEYNNFLAIRYLIDSVDWL